MLGVLDLNTFKTSFLRIYKSTTPFRRLLKVRIIRFPAYKLADSKLLSFGISSKECITSSIFGVKLLNKLFITFW